MSLTIYLINPKNVHHFSDGHTFKLHNDHTIEITDLSLKQALGLIRKGQRVGGVTTYLLKA